MRVDLRPREFASGVAQEHKFDPRDDGLSLFRSCAACKCVAQDFDVATMGLELEELETCEHQVVVGV